MIGQDLVYLFFVESSLLVNRVPHASYQPSDYHTNQPASGQRRKLPKEGENDLKEKVTVSEESEHAIGFLIKNNPRAQEMNVFERLDKIFLLESQFCYPLQEKALIADYSTFCYLRGQNNLEFVIYLVYLT